MAEIVESDAFDLIAKIAKLTDPNMLSYREPGWVDASEMGAYWNISSSSAGRKLRRAVKRGILETKIVRDQNKVGSPATRVFREVPHDNP